MRTCKRKFLLIFAAIHVNSTLYFLTSHLSYVTFAFAFTQCKCSSKWRLSLSFWRRSNLLVKCSLPEHLILQEPQSQRCCKHWASSLLVLRILWEGILESRSPETRSLLWWAHPCTYSAEIKIVHFITTFRTSSKLHIKLCLTNSFTEKELILS